MRTYTKIHNIYDRLRSIQTKNENDVEDDENTKSYGQRTRYTSNKF